MRYKLEERMNKLSALQTISKGRFLNVFTSAIAAISLVLASALVSAAVPTASIDGPIATEPHPSLNAIYSASAIELTEHDYLEEEYFIEGTARQFSNPEMENAEVLDSGHRYRTRLIVRRPISAADFNGIVIVEWVNVTGGPDKDIDWWQSGTHLIRNGYAFVVVSAQQMGIDTMKDWSPERYSSLDTTHDGMVERDGLSYGKSVV